MFCATWAAGNILVGDRICSGSAAIEMFWWNRKYSGWRQEMFRWGPTIFNGEQEMT